VCIFNGLPAPAASAMPYGMRGFRAAILIIWEAAKGLAAPVFMVVALVAAGCAKSDASGPEAVADAFCDAYFVHADQLKAKQFTAFGASKMLDQEIGDVKALRDSGYNPNDASLEVSAVRGARTARDERVRFDYTIRVHDAPAKHADVELAQIKGDWKVVRVTVAAE
jgi:hypothetical protein